MKKNFSKFLFFILLLFFAFSGVIKIDLAEAKKITSPDLNPLGDLQIEIPGLNKIAEKYPARCEIDDDDNVTCTIPWIAVYGKSVYDYLLGVGGILAAIALMIGGIIWLASSGDSARTSKAKSWISGGLTGLFLLLSSYLLMIKINPDLVNFKPVFIKSIKPENIDNSMNETGENPYLAGCEAAKKGDLSVCRNFDSSPPPYVVRIPNTSKTMYASRSTLEKWEIALDCVREKNNTSKDLFHIVDGWRSPQEQIRMKEEWTEKGKPGNAATPCCSNHGTGQALDINRTDGKKMSWDYNESSGLKECMNAEGLYANISSEPWHWSPTGY